MHRGWTATLHSTSQTTWPSSVGCPQTAPGDQSTLHSGTRVRAYGPGETVPCAGHIQVAQVPGRHEPSTEGELNYHYILQETSRLGYNGWIGCEYVPTGELHPGRGGGSLILTAQISGIDSVHSVAPGSVADTLRWMESCGNHSA